MHGLGWKVWEGMARYNTPRKELTFQNNERKGNNEMDILSLSFVRYGVWINGSSTDREWLLFGLGLSWLDVFIGDWEIGNWQMQGMGRMLSSSSSSSAGASMSAGATTSTVAPPPANFFQRRTTANRSAQKLKYFTAEEVASFDRDGFLVVPHDRVWELSKELPQIISAVNEMDGWADAPGKWMKYYEKKKDAEGKPTEEKLLQRIENFCQFSPDMDKLLNTGKLLDMCSDLFNEDSILYKEKVNYKLPGGDGFLPHQDVAAGWWMYDQSVHISVLLSIDESNKTNGALEVVRGKHLDGILGEPWKEVPQKLVDEYNWEMVYTKPGDLVFFDSFVPHRSAPNRSASRRRILYATYGKKAEGDYRAKYYEDKRKSFPPDCERDSSKKYEYKI